GGGRWRVRGCPGRAATEMVQKTLTTYGDWRRAIHARARKGRVEAGFLLRLVQDGEQQECPTPGRCRPSALVAMSFASTTENKPGGSSIVWTLTRSSSSRSSARSRDRRRMGCFGRAVGDWPHTTRWRKGADHEGRQ